jgi:hypothetical protein
MTDNEYNDSSKGLRRGAHNASASSLDESFKHNISGPYDFRHVTHTRHEQLPNIHRVSRLELAAEFSAIRASQPPSSGKLKGIKAEDLQLDNFSAEASGTSTPDGLEMRSPESHQQPWEGVRHAAADAERQFNSPEKLRKPPPRPPRSPTMPCPPPRMSSRTDSMIYDSIANVSMDRPETISGFRKSKAFHLPIAPPRPLMRSDMSEDIAQVVKSPPRSPEPEAWPLASPFESVQLADVPEEEEHVSAARRSRVSTELRSSKSVPALSAQMFAGRRGSIFHETAIPRSRGPKDEKMGVALSPSRPTVELTHDSWEDDIDYCYEHEAEADCDYKWETTSLDGAALDSPTIPHNTTSSDSKTTIKVSTTPNLVTPAATEAPLLSPLSNTSIDSPGVTTPALPRPNLTRNHSNESSFKESHGFTLSPSLLIPTDYSSQIDQDALYDELLFNDQDHQHALHAQHQFDTYRISAEGNPSSSASYRSSNWSRASASTTLSKSSSHESVVILSRAASIALQHRSISSTASGSVPDLVHSSKAKRDTAELDRARNVDTQAPEVPAVPLRNKASMGLGSPTEHDRVLSPVAEMYTDSMAMPSTSLLAGAAHGRKMSVPMHTAKPSETPKSGRKRAMSAKSKGGYNLFPQI